MAKFCLKCGAPLSGAFCGKCGADMRSIAIQPQPQPVAQMQPQTAPPTGAPIKQGLSGLAKVGIAAVAIIFVGGAAGVVGVYYVAHRVSQKIHQTADVILGSDSKSGSTADGNDSGPGKSESVRSVESGTMGNVCRLLSKQDVSKAVGVEIVRSVSKDDGCSYMAKGTQQDMSAKHLKAMIADKGADKKTQEIAEKVAGGMFNMFQADKPASEQNASGEVPVFVFSLDQHAAEQQMGLNTKVLGAMGDQQGLPGIGDQAFVSADGVILVRKGTTLVRIMYLACPCGIEQVKPLAKEIADAL